MTHHRHHTSLRGESAFWEDTEANMAVFKPLEGVGVYQLLGVVL